MGVCFVRLTFWHKQKGIVLCLKCFNCGKTILILVRSLQTAPFFKNHFIYNTRKLLFRDYPKSTLHSLGVLYINQIIFHTHAKYKFKCCISAFRCRIYWNSGQDTLNKLNGEEEYELGMKGQLRAYWMSRLTIYICYFKYYLDLRIFHIKVLDPSVALFLTKWLVL